MTDSAKATRVVTGRDVLQEPHLLGIQATHPGVLVFGEKRNDLDLMLVHNAHSKEKCITEVKVKVPGL